MNKLVDNELKLGRIALVTSIFNHERGINMSKYTIEQQAAISDIIFNYPADTDVIQSLLSSLGFELSYDEIVAEYNSRI